MLTFLSHTGKLPLCGAILLEEGVGAGPANLASGKIGPHLLS